MQNQMQGPMMPRRLPQIMPERVMPPQRPGGLRPIFNRMPRNMPRPPMSPMPPMPMPERMPMERPGFAAGTPDGLSKKEILKAQELRDKMLESRDDFRRRSDMRRMKVPSAFMDLPSRDFMISDIDRMIAEQAAREGISPAERRSQGIKNFLLESGRIISDRDAELYGMGVLNFEDLMQRVQDSNMKNILGDSGRTISNMDRNLMQQEQMFFPQSDSLDDILEDLEKKN